MKKLLTAYSKNFPELIKVYSDVLINRGVDDFFLDDAIEEIIESHEKLPTVYALIQVINKKKLNEINNHKSDEHQKKFIEEQEKFDVVKANCIKVIGADKVEPFVKYWLRHVYGPNLEANLIKWGYGLRLFEKPALLDLQQAKFDPKRAVTIGQQKVP